MKKILAAINIFLLAGLACMAQVNAELDRMITGHHEVAGLTVCPYELNPAFGDFTDTKAPKGYKPVYISHYGRHGSRSSWDRETYGKLISILEQAKEAGVLSASGDSLLHETRLILEATAGMDGRLTYRGQREHRGIASRMYRRYRGVFRNGSRYVRVLSSEVPRCLVSMAAFTGELSRLDPSLSFNMDCGSEIQKMVDNGASNEANTIRRTVLDSLRSAMDPDLEPMMKRLFTDTDAAEKIVDSPLYLSRYIYYTARIAPSFDFDFDTYRFLDDELICLWSEHTNLSIYLGQCNSELLGDDRMPRTEPMIGNIVAFADEALAIGNVAADLRFGHDYPLLALCSRIGLEGVGERYSVDEARRNFITTLYSPFAGNLQMIFYKGRKSSDPVLVKFLVNEKESSIPALESVEGPYYEWDKVKEHLQSTKISK